MFVAFTEAPAQVVVWCSHRAASFFRFCRGEFVLADNPKAADEGPNFAQDLCCMASLRRNGIELKPAFRMKLHRDAAYGAEVSVDFGPRGTRGSGVAHLFGYRAIQTALESDDVDLMRPRFD
jgi:hypothetical protein